MAFTEFGYASSDPDQCEVIHTLEKVDVQPITQEPDNDVIKDFNPKNGYFKLFTDLTNLYSVEPKVEQYKVIAQFKDIVDGPKFEHLFEV